ncbi:histidine phosphatase family protein [Aggregatimonas sangjinii]|uniref:Histidine phosphatase family protein n=1 Tax=Aggregatimonas sangjinii TaxID=2583587 RepID=A0A5B7STK0_9FLAO|nr:phosphoglycerate mutase family protein [Aggregatimonas sangjinii]QCX00241.1 histidine phosphatase family protein [Aggregatimonas sangjinii]
MKTLQIVILSLFVLGFASCKDDKNNEIPVSNVAEAVSTFYLIRHAEKDRSDPQNSDPELNQAGLGRAMHWAEILNDVALDVVYSTDYQRTAMTASPISVKKDIDVQYYDPQNIDIEQFKADNLNKNVLVVGHSNTTPDFANRLLDDEVYGQMDDTDNGSLFIVTIINGMATSQRLEINCSCPSRD